MDNINLCLSRPDDKSKLFYDIMIAITHMSIQNMFLWKHSTFNTLNAHSIQIKRVQNLAY